MTVFYEQSVNFKFIVLYFFIVVVFIVVNEVKDCSKGLFKLFQNDLILGNDNA